MKKDTVVTFHLSDTGHLRAKLTQQ